MVIVSKTGENNLEQGNDVDLSAAQQQRGLQSETDSATVAIRTDVASILLALGQRIGTSSTKAEVVNRTVTEADQSVRKKQVRVEPACQQQQQQQQLGSVAQAQVVLALPCADPQPSYSRSQQATCEHGKTNDYFCWKCGDACEHGNRSYRCEDCRGPSVCEHGRLRRTCKKC